MTTIRLSAGESLVYLRRGGTGSRRPLGIDTISMSHRAYTEIRVAEQLTADDRLELPHPLGQINVTVKLGVPPLRLPGRWIRWSEPMPPVRLTFRGRVCCRHCDDPSLHDVVMPEPRHFVGRPAYVIRTCIVCGTCWEQDVLW
ncbi:hypothetical protein [Mycolicibacterium sp.]|uniref:hypothetical protein n=1 Tax=Mycolicibacterium sp. TaxID=2320850 RepID=UPI0037C87B89